MRQKTELKITLQAGATGEARSAGVGGTEALAANTEVESRAVVGPSMEAIVERDNLRKALAQVKRNKGAAGVDGMSLDALAPHLKEHWPAIRARLLDGTTNRSRCGALRYRRRRAARGCSAFRRCSTA